MTGQNASGGGKKFAAAQKFVADGKLFPLCFVYPDEVIAVKRLILMLLCLTLLLTACGKQEKQTELPPEETVQEPTCGETISETGDYAVVCEWEAYAPDVEQVMFFVENRTSEPLETGVDFGLEVLGEDGTWNQVPMVENAGWIALGLHIPAGGQAALTCGLSVFDYDFSGGGTYRIVKELNGQAVAGIFQMTETAAVSGTRPYGFAPLEELPAHYSAADAGGGEVVFTAEGTENLAAVEAFLDKTAAGVPCQLRTVQDYGEGTPMVIDVIYENDHFLWRMWSDGFVEEQRFSYIVTDGVQLFLSNGVDWQYTEHYDSDKAFLIPGGVTGAMLTAVEQQAAGRLAGSVIRYRVWSADGVYDAALTTEPAEFSVGWQKRGEGSRGQMFEIPKQSGEAGSITALEWQGSDLLLTCDTAEGGRDRVVFHGESWSFDDKSE